MAAEPDRSVFEEARLFAGLSAEELDEVSRVVQFREASAGEIILRQGQQDERACVVVSGTLKVSLVQQAGPDVVLAVLGHGEVVGELSLVDHLGRSATVTALEPCRLLWFDDSEFAECRRRVPTLTENLLEVLARRLRLANARLQALAALSVDGRVAHQLLAFGDAYGERTETGAILIRLRLTEVDLAGLVGASRERVSQVMAIFKRNDYISVDGRHHVSLHDVEALRRHCA